MVIRVIDSLCALCHLALIMMLTRPSEGRNAIWTAEEEMKEQRLDVLTDCVESSPLNSLGVADSN